MYRHGNASSWTFDDLSYSGLQRKQTLVLELRTAPYNGFVHGSASMLQHLLWGIARNQMTPFQSPSPIPCLIFNMPARTYRLAWRFDKPFQHRDSIQTARWRLQSHRIHLTSTGRSAVCALVLMVSWRSQKEANTHLPAEPPLTSEPRELYGAHVLRSASSLESSRFGRSVFHTGGHRYSTLKVTVFSTSQKPLISAL